MNFDIMEFVDAKTLVGAVLGAGLVWFGEFVKFRLNKSKNAHYLAVRLVPILEQFLDACYDVAFDDGTIQGQPAGSDGTYEIQTPTPTLTLPDDVDWKSIDKNLLERIMSLSSELYSIIKYISSEAEFNAEPPYDEIIYIRRFKFAQYALKCDGVLAELRAILSLSHQVYPNEWNPSEQCRKFIAEAEIHFKRQQESQEQLRAKFLKEEL